MFSEEQTTVCNNQTPVNVVMLAVSFQKIGHHEVNMARDGNPGHFQALFQDIGHHEVNMAWDGNSSQFQALFQEIGHQAVKMAPSVLSNYTMIFVGIVLKATK